VTAPRQATQDRRFVAFYLPQYHPIPENDKAWGKGFTEWTNVVASRPRFRAHYQPHLPADLGFYDLRLPEVREQQADLARAHGIDGFCYYHYWFGGRRLLERPFAEVLASGSPDFPFCLCWANENWSRRWDGGSQEIIIAQNYSDADDYQHLRWLANAFTDRRYMRVDGRPLFLVYRANDLPDPLRTTTIWREEAHRLGIGDLYLCRVEAFYEDHGDPRPLGFDAAVEFQPDISSFGPRQLGGILGRAWRKFFDANHGLRDNNVYPYQGTVQMAIAKGNVAYQRYPCALPSWDNSPRRPNGARILHGSTPQDYEVFVRGLLKRTPPFSPDENLFFVNAWNEWGEGNHLEPDQRWGRAYLEAHLRATGR
jgi:lipopolysaccharide biosynthesis protein